MRPNRSFLRIWSHLLKKSLLHSCAVIVSYLHSNRNIFLEIVDRKDLLNDLVGFNRIYTHLPLRKKKLSHRSKKLLLIWKMNFWTLLQQRREKRKTKKREKSEKTWISFFTNMKPKSQTSFAAAPWTMFLDTQSSFSKSPKLLLSKPSELLVDLIFNQLYSEPQPQPKKHRKVIEKVHLKHKQSRKQITNKKDLLLMLEQEAKI